MRAALVLLSLSAVLCQARITLLEDGDEDTVVINGKRNQK